MNSPDAIELLAPLAPWFERVKRDLPWRAKDLDAPHPDPYGVLVSELMLQQTQVATVVPYYERWMRLFPLPESLAIADEDAVHKAWEGLGYYRRCRFLKAAATEIAAQGWPKDLEGLAALPGLGPYTAAAVASIAFQWPAPALDGNAFRVLARLLLIEGDPKREAERLRAWLGPALAAHGPSRMTQALMELGATLCGPAPKCGACPLASRCAAQLAGRTAEIPPVAKRAKPKELELQLIAVEAEGHFLLREPGGAGLLAGLWTWPALEPRAEEGAAEAKKPYCAAALRVWPGWVQIYTHRREAVTPLHLSLKARFPAPAGHRWIPAAELEALPLGRRDQKLRALLPTAAQAPLDAEPGALLAALRGGAAPST